MQPLRWIAPDADTLLDVGCNVGALLLACRESRPYLRLAGVDINSTAVEAARMVLPDADLRVAPADELPFEASSFSCVTCVDMLEHVPASSRKKALFEFRRVLRSGGRLIVQVPHAGLFSWLDPQNLRFRFPNLYRHLIGGGDRDRLYGPDYSVVWHHHFSFSELLGLAGEGWKVVTLQRGGLFLAPIADLARWPFYRIGQSRGAMYRALEKLASFDTSLSYGPRSYEMMLVLKRA
jgi:SAM-dependent methyltransferase